jgi:hypothetical protein
MSFFHTAMLAGASGNQGQYQIEESLRFNSGDNTVLTRNLTTQGNRTTWTFSGWFKRTEFGVEHNLWSAAPGAHASSPAITYLDFNDVDKLVAYSYHDGAERFRLKSTAVFRDPSAWYHIVWRHDTTLSTADDRIRLYVNGVQLTDFDQRTNPGSSYESKINDTVDHTLGEEAIRERYNYNGYMAEVNFIDGSALGPESFGELDANGIWRPIEYTGSYTGQSFYLKFDATDVGGDSSGLSNDFTPSTSITTSGTGTDVMSDTPTTNWATLNPLHDGAQVGPVDGNLKFAWSSTGNYHQVGTATIGMPGDGKWYWEVTKLSTRSDSESIGILREDGGVNGGMRDGQSGTPSYSYEVNGEKNKNASGSAYGATYAQNDVIGVCRIFGHRHFLHLASCC